MYNWPEKTQGVDLMWSPTLCKTTIATKPTKDRKVRVCGVLACAATKVTMKLRQATRPWNLSTSTNSSTMSIARSTAVPSKHAKDIFEQRQDQEHDSHIPTPPSLASSSSASHIATGPDPRANQTGSRRLPPRSLPSPEFVVQIGTRLEWISK